MVIIDQDRIKAAVHVDHLFPAYEIEMSPDEAFTFTEIAPLAGAPSAAEVSGMIASINRAIPPFDFGPNHPQTGNPHHAFRIGRESDRRVIKISLFKGFFQLEYDYWKLFGQIEVICRKAGASTIDIDPAPNSYSIVIGWTGETEAAQ